MAYFQVFVVLLLSISIEICLATSPIEDQEGDKIINLPGQPANVGFSRYSGYVTVNEEAGRALFYWLIESPESRGPEFRPFVLWLNGGPGCSSIACGAAEEIGPFRISSDGKSLYMSPYAWNNSEYSSYFLLIGLKDFLSISIETFTLLEKVMQGTKFLSWLNLFTIKVGNAVMDDYNDFVGKFEYW